MPSSSLFEVEVGVELGNVFLHNDFSPPLFLSLAIDNTTCWDYPIPSKHFSFIILLLFSSPVMSSHPPMMMSFMYRIFPKMFEISTNYGKRGPLHLQLSPS